MSSGSLLVAHAGSSRLDSGVARVRDRRRTVASIRPVELYGQDAELQLLSDLLAHLDQRRVIDVGAERGDFAEGLLRAGAEELHAIDPHPDNALELHRRFDADARVTVHELALSEDDGHAELHVSSSPDGTPLPYGHTLLERAGTDEIIWQDAMTVTRRSLASLVDSDAIPRRAGILKIDTEGHDLAVVRGMGALEADVVMVEHWTDLPHGLGACPWTTEEMLAALRPRGFVHFAFVVHRGDFVTLKWDDGQIEPGAMGNLVFLHERVLEALLPDLLGCAGALGESAVRTGKRYAEVARDRLAVIEELKQAADERLALVVKLDELDKERLRVLGELTAELEARDAELQAIRAADRTT
jgi:FkbM family methyltransferase